MLATRSVAACVEAGCSACVRLASQLQLALCLHQPQCKLLCVVLHSAVCQELTRTALKHSVCYVAFRTLCSTGMSHASRLP